MIVISQKLYTLDESRIENKLIYLTDLLSYMNVRMMKIRIFLSQNVFKWHPSLFTSNESMTRSTKTLVKGTIMKNAILSPLQSLDKAQ